MAEEENLNVTTKYLDDVRSLELLEAFTKDLNFEVPDVDFDDAALKIPDELKAAFSNAPTLITKELVTDINEEKYKASGSHEIEGTGSFDKFMDAYQKHLERELKEKRISGADYAAAYTQLISTAMNQAVQFELSKSKAHWDGILAQMQALNAAASLYKAKIELAMVRAQALAAKAQYAATVGQLGVLDANYGNALAQRDNIVAQTDKTREDINLVVKQEGMVAQQTVSFKRRDEYNAVKLQADAFTIQKSVDEGTAAPSVFQSAQINSHLSKHLTNVGL